MAVHVIEWQFPKMLSYIMHYSCRESVLHNNLSKRSTSDGQPGCFFDFYFVNGGDSPARMYGGILIPSGRDENVDVVYKYALKGERSGKTV